ESPRTREAGRPRRLERRASGGAAGCELPPSSVRALDQERLAARRPAERVHRTGVEELARKSPLVDDPQSARWAGRPGCGECDPVGERAKRSCAELDELISTELVAVDVQRGGVEEQAVVGVRGQKLGRRDDGAPA